jgi:hypothetical protein
MVNSLNYLGLPQNMPPKNWRLAIGVHSQLGHQKMKKGLKDFLELLFTHNIYMKQT